MQILLYGALADLLGRRLDLDVQPQSSIADLRRKLRSDHPEAAQELARSRAIIGDRAVADDYRVTADDKVEFLPPVAGG